VLVANEALPPWQLLNAVLPDILIGAAICVVLVVAVLLLRRRFRVREARKLDRLREAEAAQPHTAGARVETAAPGSPTEHRGEP
jgi:hypothetical protein